MVFFDPPKSTTFSTEKWGGSFQNGGNGENLWGKDRFFILMDFREVFSRNEISTLSNDGKVIS